MSLPFEFLQVRTVRLRMKHVNRRLITIRLVETLSLYVYLEVICFCVGTTWAFAKPGSEKNAKSCRTYLRPKIFGNTPIIKTIYYNRN